MTSITTSIAAIKGEFGLTNRPLPAIISGYRFYFLRISDLTKAIFAMTSTSRIPLPTRRPVTHAQKPSSRVADSVTGHIARIRLARTTRIAATRINAITKTLRTTTTRKSALKKGPTLHPKSVHFGNEGYTVAKVRFIDAHGAQNPCDRGGNTPVTPGRKTIKKSSDGTISMIRYDGFYDDTIYTGVYGPDGQTGRCPVCRRERTKHSVS